MHVNRNGTEFIYDDDRRRLMIDFHTRIHCDLISIIQLTRIWQLTYKENEFKVEKLTIHVITTS